MLEPAFNRVPHTVYRLFHPDQSAFSLERFHLVLNRAELVLVDVMLLVVSALCTMG